jgi:hypothetical protein
MDTPAIIIIVLSVLAAIAWINSWILDGRDAREEQPETKPAPMPLYHGQAMLGVEEF